MDQLIGKVLGNRYEIMEKIGDGGMALVYKAKCHLLNRFVAVKILRPEFVSDDDFVKKFESESQSAASLSNPNIVNIYDVGMDDDLHYIVMELVKGVTLKTYIRRHQGFIPNDEIVEISKQIALGLEHAHANGIIHRDIKPHNIMINEDGIVKVADFGIARAVTSSTIVNANEALGSVHYVSPEQARGGFVDQKSDIYSLGILMYELSTGKLPYDGDAPISVAMKHLKEKVKTPSSINGQLGKGIESVILKAIEKEPNNRYMSARELVDDLEKLSRNPDLDIPFYVKSEDSPTMIIPNLDGAADVELPSTFDKPTKKKEKAKQPRSRFGIFIGIFAGLLAAVIAVGGYAVTKVMAEMEPQVVTVPALVGKTYEVAATEMHALNLKINAKDQVFHNEVDKGRIISQSQPEGMELKEGFTIDVVVSKGQQLVKVPNIMQKDLSDAKLILENNDLSLGEVNHEFSDLPSGLIIKQSPAAGQDISVDSPVHLTISQGKPVETVIVPNLVGKTVPQARNSLEQLGLKVGGISYNFSEEAAKDRVMVQSVQAGSEVNEKTRVNLVVSKGSESGEQATETPSTETPSTETPTQPEVPAEDLIEKQFSIPLTFATDTETLKVVLVQDGNRTTVYNKVHNRTEGRVPVVVKGKGSAVLEIYYGDQMVTSLAVDFE